MKPQNKEKSAKIVKAITPDVTTMEPAWMPTMKWHLTALGIIYVCLTIAYFSISYLLSRVPPPYKLREVPKELTPWLKK